MIKVKITLSYLLAFSFFSNPSFADQEIILDYGTPRDTYFYRQLYPDGGTTLYCQASFENRSGLNVGHVYAASWMKETAGCPKNFQSQKMPSAL